MKRVNSYVTDFLRENIAISSNYLMGAKEIDDLIEVADELKELSAMLSEHLEAYYTRPTYKIACDIIDLGKDLDPFGFCLESYEDVKDLEREVLDGTPRFLLDTLEELNESERADVEELIKRIEEVKR